MVQAETQPTLTERVLQSIETTANPRLKLVLGSLIRHLHGFVQEVQLTEAEWWQAIQFLTAVGQKSDDRRQEFVLLSDTLGVSMLVDQINHLAAGAVTESTVLGPFYREGARELPNGSSISLDGKGTPAVVRGRVLTPAGEPIAGAVLDVWETAENGMYEQQDPAQPEMNLRGRFRTDAQGGYALAGVKPVSYPIPDDGPVGELLRATGRHPFRPAHIHFIVSAGGYRTLTTHLFVQGDPYLDSDAVFGTKDSLVVPFEQRHSPEEAAQFGVPAPFYSVQYDFVLQPAAGGAA